MGLQEVKQCQEAKQLLVGLSEQEVELLWHQLPKDQLPPHMQVSPPSVHDYKESVS